MKVVQQKMSQLFITTISFLFIFGSAQLAADHMSEHSVAERIKPMGSVCVEGEECQSAEVAAAPAKPAEPRSGSEIVQDYCIGCHGTGIAGAPKVGAEFKALSSKGVDKLLKVAKKGKGAMPRKGGCSDCSDQELTDAIQNMIDG